MGPLDHRAQTRELSDGSHSVIFSIWDACKRYGSTTCAFPNATAVPLDDCVRFSAPLHGLPFPRGCCKTSLGPSRPAGGFGALRGHGAGRAAARSLIAKGSLSLWAGC